GWNVVDDVVEQLGERFEVALRGFELRDIREHAHMVHDLAVRIVHAAGREPAWQRRAICARSENLTGPMATARQCLDLAFIDFSLESSERRLPQQLTNDLVARNAAET